MSDNNPTYDQHGQRLDPYLVHPTQSQAASSQSGNRRLDDNGSVVSSRQGAYGIHDRQTLAGSTADPGHPNSGGNDLSGRSGGARSHVSGINGDNNVSNVDLTPGDSQSQVGSMSHDRQSRQGAGSNGDDDLSTANSRKGNILFDSRKKTERGGPESVAGLSDISRGRSNGNPSQKPVRPKESSSQAGESPERREDVFGTTDSPPIIQTDKDKVDKWMRDAKEVLDHARLRSREPFTDKEQHAAWVGIVRKQLGSLEVDKRPLPRNFQPKCAEKIREITAFLDGVDEWLLETQSTGKKVAKKNSMEAQGPSKQQQDVRTEGGMKDNRNEKGSQAADSRNEGNINDEPTGRGGQKAGDAPPKANHTTAKRRKSYPRIAR